MFILVEEEEREVRGFVRISTSSQSDRPASFAIPKDEKIIKVEVLENI